MQKLCISFIPKHVRKRHSSTRSNHQFKGVKKVNLLKDFGSPYPLHRLTRCVSSWVFGSEGFKTIWEDAAVNWVPSLDYDTRILVCARTPIANDIPERFLGFGTTMGLHKTGLLRSLKSLLRRKTSIVGPDKMAHPKWKYTGEAKFLKVKGKHAPVTESI